MPAFGEKLDTKQIASLAECIYKPLATAPVWGEKEIKASHEYSFYSVIP